MKIEYFKRSLLLQSTLSHMQTSPSFLFQYIRQPRLTFSSPHFFRRLKCTSTEFEVVSTAIVLLEVVVLHLLHIFPICQCN
jgi:hypothetical protein